MSAVLDDEVFALAESIRPAWKCGARQRHCKRALSHLGFFHCCPFGGENATYYFYAKQFTCHARSGIERENAMRAFGEQRLASILRIGWKNSRCSDPDLTWQLCGISANLSPGRCCFRLRAYRVAMFGGASCSGAPVTFCKAPSVKPSIISRTANPSGVTSRTARLV